MTVTQPQRSASPPTPTPKPRIDPARVIGVAARHLDRACEAAWWTVFGVVARYPKSAAVLAAAVTATTPVTVGDVTGVVVGGCATAALISVGGSSGRGTNPLAILPRLSTFRRRRNLVRRRWVTVMHHAGLTRTSPVAGGPKRHPRAFRITETANGVRVYAYAANCSLGPGAFRAQTETLRNGFGCRAVTVTTTARLIVLDLAWGTDPLLRPISVNELPAARKRLHVVVGLDEQGRPVEKDMRLPNLVIGALGAGKSTEIWTTLHALQRSGIPHRIRAFDPKGGIELAPLKGRVHRYVSDPSSWDTFVQDAINDMLARLNRQLEAGISEHVPTPDEPLDVMIVDELVAAILMGGTGSKVKIGRRELKAGDAFFYFLSQCRAAGFTVLACSQVAEKEVIGSMRMLFAYVSLLRVGPTETATINMILGTGAAAAYPAHELDPHTTAGIGWVKTPTGIVRYRAARLTEAQRNALVRRMPRQK